MIAKVFPQINSIDPFESKVSTPYQEVRITDSPYTVKSHGLVAQWHVWANYSTNPTFDSTSLKWSSTISFARIDSGMAWPAEISEQYNDNKQWGVYLSGYMYFPTSTASLSFYGTGKLSFSIYNDSTPVTYYTNQQLSIVEGSTAVATSVTHSIGWHQVKMYLTSKERGTDQNTFIVRIKDALYTHFVPLAAGRVVSQNDYTRYKGYIPNVKLTGITETLLQQEKSQSSKFTFTIPIATNISGYSYNTEGDYFFGNGSQKFTTFASTVGLWRFNENLIDSSGHSNTLNSTSENYYTGHVDVGLTAYKGPVATLAAANATNFDFGTDSFTVESWLNLGAQTEVLIQKKNGATGTGYRLIHWYVDAGTNDSLRMELKTDASESVNVDTLNGSVVPNEWTYVAVVVDRSNTAKVYINGIVNGTPVDISSWVGNISSSKDFIVNGYTTCYFDEVCITKRALTSAEIYNRYRGHIIKKFNMVEYSSGYSYADSSISTITKFVGQVKGWKISRKGNKAEANIECFDWTSFLNEGLNLGYPNVNDYLTHGYTSNARGGVAGNSKPRCYDAWPLSDAVENLLLNAYIDPEIYMAKRQHINLDNIIEEGNFLVDELSANNPIYLDREFNYGKPLAVAGEGDAKYNWQFSIGDSLLDNLQKFTDNYGLQYRFNNTGKFQLESIKTPDAIKTIDDMTFTGAWSTAASFNSLYAVSNVSIADGDKAIATFVGSSAEFVIDVGNNYGTLHVKLSNPTLGAIVTIDYDTSYAKTWKFFNGSDEGNNPTKVLIGGNNYGAYSLNLTHKGSNKVSVCGLLIHKKDYQYPVATLYSGDLGTKKGVLVDGYDNQSSVEDIRNDVTVIGKLKGVKSTMAVDEADPVPINPNNLVNDHILSRAIDKVSLGSVSNINYVGRRLPMAIIEPSIVTESRAKWLAEETILRYNEFKKSSAPNINIINNPLLEVGDFVRIKDINTGIVSTINKYWIKSIHEQRNPNGKSIARVGLETAEPWESFFKYPTPSIKNYPDAPFFNIQMSNCGLPIKDKAQRTMIYTNKPATIVCHFIDGGYTVENRSSYTQTQLENRVARSGYLKFNTEIVRYTDRQVTSFNDWTNLDSPSLEGKIQFTGLIRGMYETTEDTTTPTPSSKFMDVTVSPYMTEEFGISSEIQFSLLTPGFVNIVVKDKMGTEVDVLTGNSSESDFSKRMDYLAEGKTYTYTWGLLDRFGKHNEAVVGRYSLAGDKVKDIPTVPANQWPSESWLGVWDSFISVAGMERFPIGKDFYVQNDQYKTFGEFSFEITYIDPKGEYFTSPQRSSGPFKVYSSLRHTGRGIPYVNRWVDNGMSEQLYVGKTPLGWHSKIVATTPSNWIVGTTWVDKFGNNINFPVVGGISGRYYYTGLENNGKGLEVQIKNFYPVSRLSKIEIFRQIYPMIIVQKAIEGVGITVYGKVSVGGGKESLDGTAGTFTVDENGISIFIGPLTNIPYLVGELGYVTPQPGEIWKGVTHLHLIGVIATDFSGRKSTFYDWIWYIDAKYVNKVKVGAPYYGNVGPYLDLSVPHVYAKSPITRVLNDNVRPTLVFGIQLPFTNL